MKMMPVYKVHEDFQIGFADGDFGRADVDHIVLDAGYGGLCDDIGVVDADEFVGRQLVFEGFEALEGDDLLGGGVERDVVLQAFDKQDVADVDPDITCAFLHKNIVRVGGFFFGGIRELQALFCFADGLDEALEGDWFFEIVDDIEVIALKGEFGKGGGKNGKRSVGQDFEKGETGHFGHADVDKKEIGGVGFEQFKSVDGIIANGNELK